MNDEIKQPSDEANVEPVPIENLLTIRAFCDRANISLSNFYYHVKNGRIKAVSSSRPCRRVPESELYKFFVYREGLTGSQGCDKQVML
jgi:hypothetical protein